MNAEPSAVQAAGGTAATRAVPADAAGPTAAAREAVAVRDVTVRLDGTVVVHRAGFTVRRGGWLAVIGPNGAGKSTLLRAIAGLVPFAGEVTIGGTPLRRLTPRERARRVAYAPQAPVMPPDFEVLHYVLLGRTPHLGYLRREGRRDHEVAAAALERLDLTGLRHRRLSALSGGERQRVVLARALAQQAPVLLLDEPTTALDPGYQQQTLELIDELRLSEGLTVVTTLHDLGLAGQYADELLLLVGGRAVAAGPADAVLTEEIVAAHYGARVRVVPGSDGRPIVHLVRPPRRDGPPRC